MNIFIFFLLGILFAGVISPILEEIVTLILSIIEVAKGKCSLKLAKISKEIDNLRQSTTNSSAIGFIVSEEEEEEDNDEIL